MFHAITRIGVACALTLGVAATVSAQSAQANANAQQKKEKRHPNQVPDSGVGEPAVEAASAEPEAGRDATAATIHVHADGMRAAELGESFMEAVTVTKHSDGTLQIGYYTGLDNAVRALRLLPARPLPQVFPILEEKE